MTKLSDALRGMADRAPLDEAVVSTHDAVAKVRQRRALRMTANGLVGVGAAAVLAFAIIVPSTSSSPESADSDMIGAPDVPGADAGMGEFAADSKLAYGLCGGYIAPTADEQPGTLTVSGPGEASELGSTFTYDVTLTAGEDLFGALAGPALFVVWNDIVVGTASGPVTEAVATTLTAGDEVATSVDLPLANCWDGAVLPAGDHLVVATQELFTAQVEPEPLPEPAPDPLVDPLVDPAEGGISSDAAVTSNDSALVTTGGSATGTVDSPVNYDVGFLFTSAPTPVTIAGDAPEDPFGVYLYPPAPELPDDYLTPAMARELYAAAVTTGVWDMAEGTQRVVMTNDGNDVNGVMWEQNYFGCSWDGAAAKPFTTESAQLDLLSVEGSAPDRISVSYGWVVNDNPEVALSVTNASAYSLPQMYEPNPSLVLVRDGVVVAEAYLTNVNRNQTYSDALYMEPGQTVAGDYLWRDVSGCWSDNQSLPVEAGTYTLLNAQYLYISDYANVGIMYKDDAARSPMPEPQMGGGVEGTDGAATEPAMDPGMDADMSIAPQGGDYVEFQVWTSLGTVRVTD